MAEEEKKTAPAEGAVAAPAAPAKEEKEKTGKRPQACSQCKKRLSRKQWYYREGNWFCSKGCWKTSQDQKDKKAA